MKWITAKLWKVTFLYMLSLVPMHKFFCTKAWLTHEASGRANILSFAAFLQKWDFLLSYPLITLFMVNFAKVNSGPHSGVWWAAKRTAHQGPGIFKLQGNTMLRITDNILPNSLINFKKGFTKMLNIQLFKRICYAYEW